jgi:hypothetical protein
VSIVLFVALASFAGVIGSTAGRLRLPDIREGEAGVLFRMCSVLLLVIGAAQVAAYQAVALTQNSAPPWFKLLEFIPILDRSSSKSMSATLSEALLALALVQTALLVSCAIAVRARTDVFAVKGELIVWCLGMVGIALWGHGLGSSDVYAYAAYAKSGFACYQGVSFTGSPFAVLNVLWGNPTMPCVYGPVLIQMLHAVAGWTYSPLDTVTVIRLLDGVAFVGLVITLLAFNTRLDVATTIALDGALYVQFVTDGHADILCILPIFFARLAFMHGAWRRGIVLASIAISMKIVLVIVAPLAVVGLAST